MYIDGVEIEGVTNFEYTNSVDEVPIIRLELICFGELEIDLERGI